MILRTKTNVQKTIIYEHHEREQAARDVNVLKKIFGFRVTDFEQSKQGGKGYYVLVKDTSSVEELDKITANIPC